MVRVPDVAGGLDPSEVILIQNLQAGNYQSETPSGTINGVNVTFTLSAAPSPASSLFLFLNGSRLAPGGADFTLSGSTITFTFAPGTGVPEEDALVKMAAYYLRDTA